MYKTFTNISEGKNSMSHSIEQLSINTIRTLSIDAIEKANSGHPGMPMGASTNGLYIMDSIYET